MIDDVLRNFTLQVDGRGYVGRCSEVTPPKLTIKTEEWRSGGMDAPGDVDLGLEPLRAEWMLDAVDADILAQWGLVGVGATAVALRGALQSEDGTVRPALLEMTGKITGIDWGKWKAGEKAQKTCQLTARKYKCTIDGRVLHDIDIDAMIRIIDGVDQLEGQRAALGL